MTQSAQSQFATSDEEPPSTINTADGDTFDIGILVDSSVDGPANVTEIENAIRVAAKHRGFSSGSIGVRITNDSIIRALNAKHLGHDYATDVISFGYAADPPCIEGEMVVSVDTARRQAGELGWPPEHELLLYVVHGTLHITGMEDHDPTDRAAMRSAEQSIMTELGIDQIVRFGADRIDSAAEDQS